MLKLFRSASLASLCMLSIELSAYEGFLEPAATADIASSETGVIVSLAVREGDTVAAGDVLAVLDHRVLDAALKIAEAKKNSRSAVSSSQAEWDITRKMLDEFERLYANGNARKDEVQRARSKERIAAAKLAGAKDQRTVLELEYDRIEAQIEKHVIRSPIDGEVSDVKREVGELVSASHGPFIRVVDVSDLKFVAHLPYQDVATIAPGDAVRLTVDAGATRVGRIQFVSPVVDPTSNTVRVTALFEQFGDELRSGYAGRIELGGSLSTIGESSSSSSELSDSGNPSGE